MHIVHLGTKGLPSRGGTERVVEAIVRRHAPRHDVTVFGSSRACSSSKSDHVSVIALPAPRNMYLGPVWLDVVSALGVLFSKGPDVVQIHGSENGFIAPLLRLRFPVVTTNHGPAYEREKWAPWARRAMRAIEPASVIHADIATAVAQCQARALSKEYGSEVVYIPNGIDQDVEPDLEGARTMLSDLGLEPSGYAMFAAARVDPTKGCLTLLQAWRELDRPAPLLVLGDLWHAPGHEAELREAAEGMDVHFVPRLDDKALVLGLVASAGVFVFPSTVEAMSMMMLEVVALGAPLLASDIPENTDVLPDDAWQFSAGDPHDLARAYREFQAEPEESVRERCARRAEYVQASYSWDRIAEQYEEVYERAIRQRRA